MVDQPQREQETFRKPSWSMDVKIISHISDMLDMAGDYAIKLSQGDGNAIFPLKSYLEESWLRFGGDLDTDGNMLDKNARTDLRAYFDRLDKWENENLANSIAQQKIDPSAFQQVRIILKQIRAILYAELNRNFVKFVTIYSDREKMERYSLDRTTPQTEAH